MGPAKPPWLKVKLPGRGQYYDLRRRLKALRLTTVCEEARCPNLAECWQGGTATFMIMGEVCTRACRFCDVQSGKPPALPAVDEPQRIRQAVAAMDLRYLVITSVDRDDLPDGGASHFRHVVEELTQSYPELMIELLTPDFGGNEESIEVICGSGAHVLGHNMETVRRITRQVRDARCDYDLSLAVLASYRRFSEQLIVKSSLLLGLGEAEGEILQTLADLREVGVDWVTLGQYLRPTRKHAEVIRYLTPQEFDGLAAKARSMGFPLVSAGPLVRSSYRAGEQDAQSLYLSRR